LILVLVRFTGFEALSLQLFDGPFSFDFGFDFVLRLPKNPASTFLSDLHQIDIESDSHVLQVRYITCARTPYDCITLVGATTLFCAG
jgi:hypothetical protein